MRLFKNDRINKIPTGWLMLAFSLKVIAGILYGYLHARYYPENDTWSYHNEALRQYHRLLISPSSFFSSGYILDQFNDIFSSTDYAVWKNTGNILVIKLLTLFNLLSRGNYYINVIFFNIFPLWGLYRIYKVITGYFTTHHRLLWIAVFFIPGCLFWNSGIHKDGLIVFFTGMLIYAIYQHMQRPAFKQLLIAFISLVFLFILRNVTVFLIMPAIIAWWWTTSGKLSSLRAFSIVYGTFLLLFFSSSFLPDKFNLPLRLAERQHQFMTLSANTVLPLQPLNESAYSYIKVLPQALANSFFHPYVTEVRGLLQLAAFLEVVLVWLIILLCLFFRKQDIKAIILHPFFLFLLFYSFSSILLVGYTVPFTGAIARYKSFYEMLFVSCFILIARPFSDKLKI